MAISRSGAFEYPKTPKQRRREALKKLAMGQKLGGSEDNNFAYTL